MLISCRVKIPKIGLQIPKFSKIFVSFSKFGYLFSHFFARFSTFLGYKNVNLGNLPALAQLKTKTGTPYPSLF